MKAGEGKAKKTFEELVPKEYQCHVKVFSETELHRLPKHQPWDHMIDFKSDALETLKTKIYPMPINEQKTLDQFIRENLEKGYIVPFKSPMALPVFFVKKKTGDLRLIQDYIVEHGIYPVFYSDFLLFLLLLLSSLEGLSCLCSVKAPFSASHHVCTSFLLLKRPSDAPAFRSSIGFFDF
jgi:hypothetical protein